MGMDSFQFNSRETSQASLQDSLHSLRRVMEVVVVVTRDDTWEKNGMAMPRTPSKSDSQVVSTAEMPLLLSEGSDHYPDDENIKKIKIKNKNKLNKNIG